MANRYWVGGNGNWDATAGTKWATTSGGAGGAAVPTASDDVFLDNGTGTGNVTVSATSVAKSLDCTGYVGTLTMNAQLTVSGSVTLVSGMAVAGTSTLVVDATGTITSAGLAIPWAVTLAPATTGTITLADNWDVDGLLTLGSSANVTKVLAGNTIYAGAGVSINSRGFQTSSTTTNIIMNGTGTLQSIAGSFALHYAPITINTAGTVTFGTNIYVGVGGLFYVAGTVVTTSSTVNISSANATCVLDLAGITINNLTFLGGGCITTLNSAITMNGTLSTGNATCNGFSITCSGSLTAGNNIFAGTTTVILNGTGTWSATGASAIVATNLTINTSGTITISGNVYYRTGTLTYTAGTVVTTSSTLNMGASTTLNTSGITWNNITITSASPTITLNSLLLATGTLTTSSVTATLTFAGTSGFTVATWTDNMGGMTIKLGSTLTYNVTSSLTLMGTAASRITLNASSGGSQAILTLDNGATQSVGYVSATDINSGLGQTIWDYKPVLSNTINWNTLGPTLLTISNVSMS